MPVKIVQCGTVFLVIVYLKKSCNMLLYRPVGEVTVIWSLYRLSLLGILCLQCFQTLTSGDFK